jgi:nitroreductase
MDALEALLTRTSAPRLGGSEPDETALDNMFRAALRAPDHGLLRPWRFLLIRGDARMRLGDLFVQAQQQDEPDIREALLEKTRTKPLRAPLIIVVVVRLKQHPKVPEIEQFISAGAAAENMLLAAHAQGVGAMWRTGSMAYHRLVHKGLGLAENERIAGFLYVGEIEGRSRQIAPLPVGEFFEEWR